MSENKHPYPTNPPPPAPPTPPSPLNPRIPILLAEYGAMRSEILQSSSTQHTCLGFALTLIGATVGILATYKGAPYTILPGASIALCCLGIVYLDIDSKILRIAHFIENHLKPQLEAGAQTENLLNWEKYFRGEYRPLSTRPTLLGKAGSTFESLFFFLPALGFWLKGMILMQAANFNGPFRLLGFYMNLILLSYLLYGIGRGHDRTIPKHPKGVPPFLDLDEPPPVHHSK